MAAIGQQVHLVGGPAATFTLNANNVVILSVIAGLSVLALVAGVVLRGQVVAADTGTEKMQEIARAVQEGAAAYLKRQFKTLAVFAAVVFGLLFLLPGESGVRIGRSVFFLLGAGFSAAIGWLGMTLATHANVRVAAAARSQGRDAGMMLALKTGGAVGMFTVGLGLLGAAVVVLVYRSQAPAVLEGFGFGAALLAMFMRVGGGIFTKAADVGADLVGKVEAGIPEDDPRNAATIADNVGDNVGDCAGMAADLFESYAVTLVAALILGKAAFGESGLIFPLIIPAVGLITAMLGILITRPRTGEAGLTTINRGFYISAAFAAIVSTAVSFWYLPSSFNAFNGVNLALTQATGDPRVLASVAVALGIVLAGVILSITGYFTDTATRPTRNVARTALTGPATVVLAGIGVGFESAVYTSVIIASVVFAAFWLGSGSIVVSLFLIALAGCGLLTTVGVIVAMDTFGPVSDNAQGIAEMSGDVHGEAANALGELDAVGNTTKAITKGIAIATAVLAACALFGSYTDVVSTALAEAGITLASIAGAYQVVSPETLVGLILGASVVFLFSGLAIDAVTRAAGAIVLEVRRQFREKPGIMDGTERPEYARVVDMCTRDSLRELATPGLLAALSPVAVGFGLGFSALAGFLAGTISTGVLMAIFLANAGGSWDNAKKIVEDGAHGGKGSPAHAAAVIGDTVGDPFKDTAGPAINPLIKVMNLVALLIAPSVVMLSYGSTANTPLRLAIAAAALAGIIAALVVTRNRASSDSDRSFDIAQADEAGAVKKASEAGAGTDATFGPTSDVASPDVVNLDDDAPAVRRAFLTTSTAQTPAAAPAQVREPDVALTDVESRESVQLRESLNPTPTVTPQPPSQNPLARFSEMLSAELPMIVTPDAGASSEQQPATATETTGTSAASSTGSTPAATAAPSTRRPNTQPRPGGTLGELTPKVSGTINVTDATKAASEKRSDS